MATNGSPAGKVAIVTGAGRGLGRAMALGLAQAGAQVVATAARKAQEVEQLAQQTKALKHAGRIEPLVADVANEGDCVRVIETAHERFGSVNILVNNAGRGMDLINRDYLVKPTRFWEVQPDIWREIIDVNVNGPFLMARAAVPDMLSAGWGRIINISMNYRTIRRAGFSPDGPSKAALEAETAIWAKELSDTGVTVNALLPGGPTLSGMVKADKVRTTPVLEPEIMIAPLLWLASESSDAVTGMRFTATRWRTDLDPKSAAAAAGEAAAWHD